MKVNDESMQKIIGGKEEIGSTFLNYLSTALKTIYNIGQEMGGSIRRIATGKICPL